MWQIRILVCDAKIDTVIEEPSYLVQCSGYQFIKKGKIASVQDKKEKYISADVQLRKRCNL